MISGFVDTYLSLTAAENELFNREINNVPQETKETIMQITTSWKEEGIAEGIQQGEFTLVIRQLARKLGALPVTALEAVRTLSIARLEELGDALLDFRKREDLEAWLRDRGVL